MVRNTSVHLFPFPLADTSHDKLFCLWQQGVHTCLEPMTLTQLNRPGFRNDIRKSQQGLCCVHCVCGTFNQHHSLQRRQLPCQYQRPTKGVTSAATKTKPDKWCLMEVGGEGFICSGNEIVCRTGASLMVVKQVALCRKSTSFTLLCMYVCVCVCVCVCVWKHHTDATSFQDCTTLHRLMLQTDLSHLGILPLQYIADPCYASIRERHWWFIFISLFCNDVAPGISTDGEGSGPRGWLNQLVLSVLNSIKEAHRIQGWARLRFLCSDLQQLASQMSIPLYAVGSIVVPNLLPHQKSAIHGVSRKMIASITGPTWEKQALCKAIGIVQSNPHTVQQIFASHASQFDKLAAQPGC